jgi:1-aminocyclopropane-1-carboxylate deaminase
MLACARGFCQRWPGPQSHRHRRVSYSGPNQVQVLQIARDTADLVEIGEQLTADVVLLFEDYAYPVYGVSSQETRDAIRRCARLEGMIADPVHEGKSMQGMIDLVAKGYFPQGSKILYAHLGGAPALNGYGYAFRTG